VKRPRRESPPWGQRTAQPRAGAVGACAIASAAAQRHVGPSRQPARSGRRILLMSIEELEAAALKLDPKDRARLAERLLDSLEQLSAEENARLWAEEAQRRSDAMDVGSLPSRAAEDVFRDARRRL
jgi:hypothetical protein